MSRLKTSNQKGTVTAQVELLKDHGYTLYAIAKMLNQPYDYVRKVNARLRKANGNHQRDDTYEFSQCTTCGGYYVHHDPETGEMSCRSCGLVLGYVNSREPPDGEKFFRSPENSMMHGKAWERGSPNSNSPS